MKRDKNIPDNQTKRVDLAYDQLNNLIKELETDKNINPVNGQHLSEEDEDEKTEDDLILGDEDEAKGDEEEFDVELDDELDEADIDEDDLVIDKNDDIEEEDDEDL